MPFTAVRWSRLAHRIISLRRKIWSLLDHSGHCSALARDGSVAIVKSGHAADVRLLPTSDQLISKFCRRIIGQH